MVISVKAERLEREARERERLRNGKTFNGLSEGSLHDQRTGLVRWIVLGLVFTVLPYILSRLHYALPEPLPPKCVKSLKSRISASTNSVALPTAHNPLRSSSSATSGPSRTLAFVS